MGLGSYNIISVFAMMVFSSLLRHGAIMLVINHCRTFHLNHRGPLCSLSASIQSTKSPLDPDTAAQFSIQVCTSTSCTRKLDEAGLDQYHVLGEIYARAQSVNLEKCMIIEDGGCQGGRNCKMGGFPKDFSQSITIFQRSSLLNPHLLTSISYFPTRTVYCHFACRF